MATNPPPPPFDKYSKKGAICRSNLGALGSKTSPKGLKDAVDKILNSDNPDPKDFGKVSPPNPKQGGIVAEAYQDIVKAHKDYCDDLAKETDADRSKAIGAFKSGLRENVYR